MLGNLCRYSQRQPEPLCDKLQFALVPENTQDIQDWLLCDFVSGEFDKFDQFQSTTLAYSGLRSETSCCDQGNPHPAPLADHESYLEAPLEQMGSWCSRQIFLFIL